MTPHNPLTQEFLRRVHKIAIFAGLVEDTLDDKVAQFHADIDARSSAFPLEERQEFFEAHAEDYFELADELPTILRYSVLTAADAALEVYLNNTCDAYAQVSKTPLVLKDITGTGIERARKYLKKVAGVPFPDQGLTWTTVLRLHDVRNSLVHADGVIAPSKTELTAWAKSVKGLLISSQGIISLRREFTAFLTQSHLTFSAEFDEACKDLGLWASVFPVEDV